MIKHVVTVDIDDGLHRLGIDSRQTAENADKSTIPFVRIYAPARVWAPSIPRRSITQASERKFTFAAHVGRIFHRILHLGLVLSPNPPSRLRKHDCRANAKSEKTGDGNRDDGRARHAIQLAAKLSRLRRGGHLGSFAASALNYSPTRRSLPCQN